MGKTSTKVNKPSDTLNQKSSKEDWMVPPGLIQKVYDFANLYYELRPFPTKKKHVLIIGDTGVGKSLFVHLFYKLFREEFPENEDPKKEKHPIIRCNIASLSRDLIDSELFGHVKGSFTGAEKNRKGLIEEAKGGVLVLEEIGDIPKYIQAKLLTFMENGEYRKVGSNKVEKADVQFIGTTSQPRKKFREDFWNRFFPFKVPHIYQRRQDILIYLSSAIPDIVSQLRPYEILLLLAYNWPGNVREIERMGLLLKWKQKKVLIDDQIELEGDLFRQLYPFDIKEYTSLDMYTLINTVNGMTISGVDTVYLNALLKDYYIGFDPGKELPVGLSYNNIVAYEGNIEDRFGIEAIGIVENFHKCYKGLVLFCELSRQNLVGNKNLLDLRLKSNETANELKSLSARLKDFKIKATPDHYKLEKQIFEYRLGRKLPDNLKKLPLYVNPFIKSPDKNDDQEIDLHSSSEDMISKYVYRKRIEQFGNLNNAADSLKIAHSTFRGRIKSKFPELLPPKKRNNSK